MVTENSLAVDRPVMSRPVAVQKLRLAIIVSHPIQHFCPMYRDIAADGRVDLQVIFAESVAAQRFDDGFGRVVEWQKDILDGYSHTVVDGTNRAQGVVDALSEFGPDVIYVHGYATPYYRKAMQWARRRNIPVMLTTDSELKHWRPWYVQAVKRVVMPWTLRNVDLFLTVGDENERYFSHYGVSSDRFHRATFSIDSACYDAVLARRAQVRESVRRRHGISDDTVVVLTVGKLIPRKGQADLVRAFAQLTMEHHRPAVLLIAGEGSERPNLEALAQPIGDSVQLLGFIGVEQLPEYYAAADIYAHPSSFDPHPLAISEALYCSLPVVVSDRVGSAGPTDDVQEGRNGWIYPSGDFAALARILANLIDYPEVRKRAGEASRSLGEVHASVRCATRFIEASQLVRSRVSTKAAKRRSRVTAPRPQLHGVSVPDDQ